MTTVSPTRGAPQTSADIPRMLMSRVTAFVLAGPKRKKRCSLNMTLAT